MFPNKGGILVGSLKTRGESFYCDIITTCSSTASATCNIETCTFSGDQINIILSFANGIPSGKIVKIVIRDVEYNDRVSAKSLTLTTMYETTNYICGGTVNGEAKNIEKGTNINQWIPKNPADFASISSTFNPLPLNTCGIHSMTWRIVPSVDIRTNSLMIICFPSDTNLDSVTSSDFASIDKDANRCITVKTSTNYLKGNTQSFTFSGITMPTLEGSFLVSIKTYTVSITELVHSGSITTLVKAKEFINAMTIYTQENPSTVWKEIGYYFCLNADCGPLTTPKYSIKYPSRYTSSLLEFDINSTNDLTTGSTPNQVDFPLGNPPAEIYGSSLASEYFIIKVSANGKMAFTYMATIDPDVMFTPGNISPITVISGRKGSSDVCIYTFTIQIAHRIPSAGRIDFSLNSNVGWINTPIVTIDGMQFPRTSGSAVIKYENSIVSIPVEIEMNHNNQLTNVTITIKNLRNPSVIGTYGGFEATSYDNVDSSGKRIDKTTSAASIVIDMLGSATVVQGTPTSSRNLELSDFTFTFSSTSIMMPSPAAVKNYINIKFPIEVTSCQETSPNVALSCKTSDSLCFEITGTPSNSVVLKFKCKNPRTTAPTDKFILNLYNEGMIALLQGETRIQTNFGAALKTITSPVTCSPLCPLCDSVCRIEFKREAGAAIKLIVIYNNELSTTGSTCTAVVESRSSTCSMKQSPSRLEIVLDSQEDIESFMITNVKLVTPSGGESVFKIVTYEESTIDKNAMVDQENTYAKIMINCNFPCKGCDPLVASKCTSCTDKTDNNGNRYYYYTDRNQCLFLENDQCDSGYYKTTSYECIQCNLVSCKQCTGSPITCTACNTDKPYLVGSICYATCPSGKYSKPEANFNCYDCVGPCLDCIDNLKCLSCRPLYVYYPALNQCLSNCPNTMYNDNGVCKPCNILCKDCVTTESTCISCNSQTYLLNNVCVSKEVCENDRQHIASDTLICTQCSSECVKCTTTIITCTECSSTKFLYQFECRANCPAGYYGLNSVCNSCRNNCATCTSDTICLTCNTNMFFVPTQSTCVYNCETNYYKSGGNCLLCHSSCQTCRGPEINSCLTCPPNRFLYSSTCYLTCPANTYESIDTCVACDRKCIGCRGSSENCLDCITGYYFYNNGCYNPCPVGMLAVIDTKKCEPCDNTCFACSGSKTFCTACHGNQYAYDGACYGRCPSKTTPDIRSSTNTCIACDPGCDECKWKTEGQTSTLTCVKCSNDFKYLDGTCLSVCPSDYVVSTDGLSCIRITPIGQNQTNPEKTAVANDYLPFPHLIGAVLLAIIIFSGQYRDGRALIVSNLIVAINYVVICSYVIQTVLAQLKKESTLAIVSAVALILQLITNFLFMIAYKRSISPDPGFSLWSNSNVCIKVVLLILSIFLTFQTSRLFYSRFMGFSVFFVSFANFSSILNPLSAFSLLQITIIQSLIIVLDIFALFKLTWGNTLYVVFIESLVLSVVLLILLCYEIKATKNIKEELEKESQYTSLKDSTILTEAEAHRKKMLEKMFNRLFKDKEKLTRRASFESMTGNDKEIDPRKIHSFPSSPKTAEAKEVPLREYGIDETAVVAADKLPVNVYWESKSPEQFTKVEPSEQRAFECQSPPFEKIDAFLKHLKAQGWKQRRFRTPLEVISETDENDEQKWKTGLMFPLITSEVPGLAEEEKVKSSELINRPASPPQITNEELCETMSKPLNPITAQNLTSLKQSAKEGMMNSRTLITPNKMPNVFDFDDKFQYASSNMKLKDRSVHRESVEIAINDEEILGVFDKDPVDGCILIRENSQGYLVDLKNRGVNKYGYLIDKDGNILNQQGDYVMSKKEFEKEIEESENPNFSVKSNTYIKGQIEKQQRDQKKPVPEQKTRALNEARKSASLDSMMQDTPSNYNIPNQRYNESSSGMQKKESIISKDNEQPNGDDILNKIYGVRPIPKKSKKNANPQSTKKHKVAKVFKQVEMKREYSSDFKPDIEGTTAKMIPTGVEENTEDIKVPSFEDKPLIKRRDFNDMNEKHSATYNNINEENVTQVYKDGSGSVIIPFNADDKVSMSSKDPSMMSRSSNRSNKFTGLERIYLQKLDKSSKNVKAKAVSRPKPKRELKRNTEPEQNETVSNTKMA